MVVRVAHLVRRGARRRRARGCGQDERRQGRARVRADRRSRAARGLGRGDPRDRGTAEQLDPGIATTAFIKEDRGGKVFVDSTRGRRRDGGRGVQPARAPGCPVSFPVAWDDLDHVSPADFTVHTAVELLGDRDPVGRAHAGPQHLSADLVAEGHAIPVARVQAMHEGKRRARQRRDVSLRPIHGDRSTAVRQRRGRYRGCPMSAPTASLNGAHQPDRGRPRALPLAARRARQLAALRPARCHRSGHRLGQDRRRDRRRGRRAAPGSLRARRRAVARAHGAVARPADRRAARRADRPAGRQRHGRPDVLRRARRDPPLGRRVQAGPARRRPAGCSSPTSATASAAGSCGGRCSRSTRNGSASPRRWSAATTRSPSCCCRTSAASATATASSRPSPTACARRPRVAFVGVELSVEERAEYAATEQRLVSARQHLRAGARHAARAVRRLPRRGRAPRRARRRRRRPRRTRVPRRVLQAAPDRGADQRQVRAARQPRARDQGRRRRAGVHRDRARREPRHQPARSAGVDRPHHRVDGPRGSGARSSTTSATGSSTPSPRPACSTKASTCPTPTSASS